MSPATATEAEVEAEAPAPRKWGKKKLIMIIGVAVLVLGLGSGGAAFYLKKKAAAAAEAADAAEGPDGAHAAKKKPAHDPNAVPTFVPLEPFTVNLADRDAERYAQVAVSLELSDPKIADKIKVFMPVIRNNILMVLSHKTSAELLGREGKAQLAREIQRETSRALGAEVEEADAETPAAARAKDDEEAAKDAKMKIATMKETAPLPVSAVHFSNFIIQ